MKSISRLVTFCAVAIAMVSVISCKKGDTGPAGPAGPQGPAGPAGVAGPTGQSGNANVMAYDYFPHDASGNYTGVDFSQPKPANGFEIDLLVQNDTLDMAAWFVYINRGGIWFSVPGESWYDSSTYAFSSGYYDQAAPYDTAFFLITRPTGPGAIYTGIRIVRILLSGAVEIQSSGGSSGNRRGLPNIDFGNYEEVKKYYHLQ